MNLFRKFLGNVIQNEDDVEKSLDSSCAIDELFTKNFIKNGGKFLYCETIEEIKENFLNILEENDWFECDVLCFDPLLFSFLDENKLRYTNPQAPKFILASCENLIANEGGIFLSSKQIKEIKANELPSDIIIIAKVSQIIEHNSDGLKNIIKKYDKKLPTNITTIRNFGKNQKDDFLYYGTKAKNLYLLLLEDY